MNIIIRNTNEAHKIIEKNEINWKLYSKSSVRPVLIIFFIGLIFIICGVVTGYTFKVYENGKTAIYNLNIAVTIGISFCLLGIIYTYLLFQNKKNYFLDIDKFIGQHAIDPTKGSIQITDDYVNIDHPELKQEIKWSMFTKYKLYKNFLFLISDETVSLHIVINKAEISAAEFEELLSFVKKKLVEKK